MHRSWYNEKGEEVNHSYTTLARSRPGAERWRPVNNLNTEHKTSAFSTIIANMAFANIQMITLDTLSKTRLLSITSSITRPEVNVIAGSAETRTPQATVWQV